MTEALALIPYADLKLTRFFKLLKNKQNVRKQVQEYQQFLQWTDATLQISTAFDWGHTCDIAQAISNCASQVLGPSNSFIFTSRTLLSKFLAQPIGTDLWLGIITAIISADVLRDESEHLDTCQDESEQSIEVLGNRPGGVVQASRMGPRGWLAVNNFERISLLNAKAANEVSFENRRVVEILQNCLALFSHGYMKRCCENIGTSRRKRAMQVKYCEGPRVLCMNADRPRISTWESCRTLARPWVEFIEKWDVIVRMASLSFPFPHVAGISDLVFHDMATGYVGSTKLLRVGGKCTNETGTTIVHPTERAAVVSSRCQLLDMKGSAIAKHGLKRNWDNAAKEFAKYALLRCDLVKPARMNFKDAVRDWESNFAKWDRCPAALSEWANHEPCDWEADDYRVVLLRQGLGTKRSVHIRSAPGTDASIFGGYMRVAEPNDDRFYDLVAQRKGIVIDQPLTLTVTGEFLIQKSGCFIKDTWGFMGKSFHKEDGYGEKRVYETGLPGVYVVKPLRKSERKDARRDDEAFEAGFVCPFA